MTDDQRGGARQRLLDAAAQHLARHGYEGTGINAVLADAGVTNSSLYHHFPGGKAELAAAAMGQVGAGTRDLLALLLADGVAGAIEALFDAGANQLVADGYGAGCRIATPLADGAEHEPVRATAAAVFASWEAVVADALVAEGWPADDAAAMGTTAVALFEGALLLARAERDTRPLDVAKQATLDLVAARRPAGAVSGGSR